MAPDIRLSPHEPASTVASAELGGSSGTGRESLELRIAKLEEVTRQLCHKILENGQDRDAILQREEHIIGLLQNQEHRLLLLESNPKHPFEDGLVNAIDTTKVQEESDKLLKALHAAHDRAVRPLKCCEDNHAASSSEDDAEEVYIDEIILANKTPRGDLGPAVVPPLQCTPNVGDVPSGDVPSADAFEAAVTKSNHEIVSLKSDSSAMHEAYIWEDSVYDSMLFIFMDGLKTEQSLLVICAFLMNMFMVTMTCSVVLGDDFQQNAFDDEQLAVFKDWRYWDAHSFLRADSLTQMTLVTRVCSEDGGLSFANYQTEVIKSVRAYLKDRQGFLLCNVAIIAWMCSCTYEIRRTITFILTLVYIPRSLETVLEESDGSLRFVSVVWTRAALGIFVAACRISISVVLGISGTIWLAYTTSIMDLLLNAHALGFVLEIDNVVFNVVAPHKVIHLLMRELAPGELPKNRVMEVIPYAMMFVTLAGTFCVNVALLQPLKDQMKAASDALCEPADSQLYALGINPLGWITYTSTPTFDEAKAEVDQTPQMDVVMGMIDNPSEYESYALQMESLEHLSRVSTQSVADYVNSFSCDDYQTLKSGSSSATVGKRLYSITKNLSLKSLTTCEEMKPFCLTPSLATNFVGINARFMCPHTCGCSSTTAGLWDVAPPKYGCPDRHCTSRLLRHLREEALCVDYDINSLRRSPIKEGWNFMTSRMKEKGDIGTDVWQNLSSLGCMALQYLPDWQVLDLCSMNAASVNHGAATFCPVACKCQDAKTLGALEECPGLCPKSCCP